MTQEPLPPLTDYAVLLQRLAAHLQVAAGLLHDIAEYNPDPEKFRSVIATIAAQFSFMNSSSDPAHSPDVLHALSAARARTTTSILTQIGEQAKLPILPIIPPTCSRCGARMDVAGWTLTEHGYAILWDCPQECIPPEPDLFEWSTFLDNVPDESHNPFYEWNEF